MNRQEQQRAAGQWAAQWQAGGLPYIPPQCSVIPYESEGFICGTIRHRAENSTEEEWEEDEELEGDYSYINSRFDWR